jgi:hypothetical protein
MSWNRGCGLALFLAALVTVAGFSAPAPTGQFPPGVRVAVTTVPADQSKEHAPLRVDSVAVSHDGPIGVVEVHNTTHKAIVGYTLGWRITDFARGSFPVPRSGSKSLDGFVGPSVTTNLQPKKSEKTDQGKNCRILPERA